MHTVIFERALGWLDQHRSQFLIVNEQSHPYYSIKPVAELAEAALVLSRSSHAQLGRAYLDHAWQQLRKGDLIGLLIKGPDTLVQAALYMPFHRAGLRNEALESLIADRSREAASAPALHRLPIAATLATLGLPSPWQLADVIADEWATRMGSPFSLSATDLYMATHIAFYATDYGKNPGGLAEPQVEYLRRWVPVWLDELAARGQYDLVAELAIAAHCIGPECVAPKVWKVLAEGQRGDGAIPYEANDQRQVGVTGMTPQREQFLRDYHSTLVTIMACAVCTHPAAVN